MQARACRAISDHRAVQDDHESFAIEMPRQHPGPAATRILTGEVNPCPVRLLDRSTAAASVWCAELVWGRPTPTPPAPPWSYAISAGCFDLPRRRLASARTA